MAAPAAPTRRYRRLRVLRESLGLSQTALAKLAGSNQPSVSIAEHSGVATPVLLAKLARALSVEDPSTLLDVVEFQEARATPHSQPAEEGK